MGKRAGCIVFIGFTILIFVVALIIGTLLNQEKVFSGGDLVRIEVPDNWAFTIDRGGLEDLKVKLSSNGSFWVRGIDMSFGAEPRCPEDQKIDCYFEKEVTISSGKAWTVFSRVNVHLSIPDGVSNVVLSPTPSAKGGNWFTVSLFSLFIWFIFCVIDISLIKDS